MSFQGKHILITGASDGIGAELARQLAGDRPRLTLAARRLDKLDAVAAQCRARGAEVLTLRCDVGVEADCRALVAQSSAHFGAIDVLVNNAGISMQARFDEIPDTRVYEDLMRINFMGAVWCTHAALPAIKQTRGLLVGVSSLAGLVGVPERSTYCATKHAMAGFFDALRIELAPEGVDVLMVYPGVVATQIRQHGWNAHGGTLGYSGLDEAGAMSVEECAAQIATAMRGRKRELVMTAKGRIGRLLKLIAPTLVDNMARAALNKDRPPQR
ncbi:MAG TPA: SDR family oxidoreductase [Burkholderiaceae bacterium]|nr:SDR family oxidoreductase [Burkholderiaceae bacterium]